MQSRNGERSLPKSCRTKLRPESGTAVDVSRVHPRGFEPLTFGSAGRGLIAKTPCFSAQTMSRSYKDSIASQGFGSSLVRARNDRGRLVRCAQARLKETELAASIFPSAVPCGTIGLITAGYVPAQSVCHPAGRPLRASLYELGFAGFLYS